MIRHAEGLPLGRHAATSSLMLSILMIVNTCVAVALVVLILLQKTDPAAGGMFGGVGGGAQTVVRNPLARPTSWLAALFMVLCLAMAVVGKEGGKGAVESVMADAAPAAPSPATLQAGMIPGMPLALISPATVVSPVAAPTTASPSTEVSVSPSQGPQQ